MRSYKYSTLHCWKYFRLLQRFGPYIFNLCDSQLLHSLCTFHWNLCVRLHGLTERPLFTARWSTLRWCRRLCMLNMRTMITMGTSLNSVVPTNDSKAGILVGMFAPRSFWHRINSVGHLFIAWRIVRRGKISFLTVVEGRTLYLERLYFTESLRCWSVCWKHLYSCSING